MIRFSLALFFLIACSSPSLTRKELIQLSASHYEIPVADEAAARKYMEEQKKYLTLLVEPFTTSPMPDSCRNEKIIGNVKDTKSHLWYASLIRVDRQARPVVCHPHEQPLVWDIYSYCKGDSRLLNIKILQAHLPEMKDISICN